MHSDCLKQSTVQSTAKKKKKLNKGRCIHLNPFNSEHFRSFEALQKLWDLLTIRRFSEPGLREWMPLVIFRARSCERLQCPFQADFWVGIASCYVWQWKLNCKAVQMPPLLQLQKKYRGKGTEGRKKSSTQFVNVHSSDTHFGFNQITEISPQLQFLFSFFSDIEAQVKVMKLVWMGEAWWRILLLCKLWKVAQ